MCNRKGFIAVAVVVTLLAGARLSWAVDGPWQLGGLTDKWSDTTNWVDGVIADGADSMANFIVDNPAGGVAVNVDAAGGQTIGNVFFGYDLGPLTPGGWLVYGNTLNMARTSSTRTFMSTLVWIPSDNTPRYAHCFSGGRHVAD